MSTQLGKIATLLDQTEENVTPLQKSLDIFGKRLTLDINYEIGRASCRERV